MKRIVALLWFLIAATPAAAQWNTLPQYSLGVSRGPGVSTPGAVTPSTAGRPIVSQGATANPIFSSTLANLTTVGIGVATSLYPIDLLATNGGIGQFRLRYDTTGGLLINQPTAGASIQFEATGTAVASIGFKFAPGGTVWWTMGATGCLFTDGQSCAGARTISADGYYRNGAAIPWTVSAPLTLSADGVVACATCLTGLMVGTTTIASGTTTRILYDNAGVLGEYPIGTGVATALAVNVGSAGAFVTFNGALGTPSSGTLTNATGLPTTGLTGTLQAAQEPAHTGDVTNTAGSLALTIANNAVTLAKLATQATNTVLGNATSGTAVPTALAVGSCSTAGSALIWTTNTGFGCNTSITAAAVPASGLTGATLAAGVTASSLTSVGTLTSLTVTGLITANGGVSVPINSFYYDGLSVLSFTPSYHPGFGGPGGRQVLWADQNISTTGDIIYVTSYDNYVQPAQITLTGTATAGEALTFNIAGTFTGSPVAIPFTTSATRQATVNTLVAAIKANATLVAANIGAQTDGNDNLGVQMTYTALPLTVFSVTGVSTTTFNAVLPPANGTSGHLDTMGVVGCARQATSTGLPGGTKRVPQIGDLTCLFSMAAVDALGTGFLPALNINGNMVQVSPPLYLMSIATQRASLGLGDGIYLYDNSTGGCVPTGGQKGVGTINTCVGYYVHGSTFLGKNTLAIAGTSSGTTTFAVQATASGTISFPAATDTVALLAATQTLTNKALTSPAIARGTINGLTSFSLRDGSADFDFTILAVSSPVLTAAQSLTFNTSNVSHTIDLGLTAGVITFPNTTADTVVMQATTQELTNKTLTSSVGKGTWTASGTWTLPAHTLSGAISGGANQINNIVIGASTPLAGTFTTLVGTGGTLATLTVTGLITANGGVKAASGGVFATGAIADCIASAIAFDYAGSGRFLACGPDASTNGSMNFQTRRSDASNTKVALTVNPTGTLTFDQYTTAGALVVDAGGNVTATVGVTCSVVTAGATITIAKGIVTAMTGC